MKCTILEVLNYLYIYETNSKLSQGVGSCDGYFVVIRREIVRANSNDSMPLSLYGLR
jgi:hypothetical protein